ncbi:hypothetical protein F358_097 [Campylobacter phage F358]|uniref:Uncharacterized protein n=8 Tax=Fletchervirus CPX TaxID=1110702 RepID=A0A7T3N2M0_9CAUD|nr:hypothetical protein F348_101 [Campylobacter phage F348]QPX63905.1 hypothetical protein F357_098 [Campylobacter phage F357]QPX64068.1 hypothetical protein F358_097 [Campylobacter phage F358]QPX64231.1 hypothetical protein F360_098 [Campylobacter phage F360]QPX64396.1 hypothetical protein F361_099 [Campylobacter phage F361]QPX64560.1 hypothetical protein F365_097 [Campylobacter phage F365]QPX64725.1 hypothetical protein F367_099 [Campylobacter phage F367]QPX64890.1 hypothetical protein F36
MTIKNKINDINEILQSYVGELVLSDIDTQKIVENLTELETIIKDAINKQSNNSKLILG